MLLATRTNPSAALKKFKYYFVALKQNSKDEVYVIKLKHYEIDKPDLYLSSVLQARLGSTPEMTFSQYRDWIDKKNKNTVIVLEI